LMRARRVADDVFIIGRTSGSNVYLLDGERPVMIDSGFPMDARRLARCIDSLPGGAPRLGIATHCHLDHTGAFTKLKKIYGLRLAAHEFDADVIEGTVHYDEYRVDRVRTAYYGLLKPLFSYENTAVEERLVEGDLIDSLGGLRVILVTGHTRGSIVLHQPERGLLFTGDVIRNERGVLDGPPPQFSPGIEETYFEIKRKMLGLEYDVLLPGHGEPVCGGAGRMVVEMMRMRGRLG